MVQTAILDTLLQSLNWFTKELVSKGKFESAGNFVYSQQGFNNSFSEMDNWTNTLSCLIEFQSIIVSRLKIGHIMSTDHCSALFHQ